ncbi:MAG TPA: ThiF family adenylyltransferase [Anaeromyxobacteraceae bacterium]|nr:ThiF family adenylyltransferase [Anaeromyxobacteraceae bacterium]
MTLDADRIARFSRQLVIPAVGEAGQERLAAARVRVVGASGTAAPGILYLVLAGVGTVWIDDPEQVTPADEGQWLFPPTVVGEPRAATAAADLQERSRFVHVAPLPPEGAATAALVFAPSAAQSVAAAERARREGIPHVVVDPDGEGGGVVSVPTGAPCYSCARSVVSARRPPTAAGAALAALAAEELILLLAAPGPTAGRRIDLTRGVPTMRATVRLAGCACGAEIAR